MSTLRRRRQRHRLAQRIVVSCVAISIAVLAAACSGGSGPAENPGLEGDGVAERSYAGSVEAPEFPEGLTWFNVQRPLKMEDLRGKAVIFDFWTQGCINCQHIIPDLHRLEEEFGDRLAVVGVHSGKYAEEKDNETIRESIVRNEIAHPVVNDADFQIWQTYGVQAWPTTVLIDPDGKVVGYRSGEGVYDFFQPIVEGMLAEFSDRLDTAPLLLAPEGESITPTVLSYPAAVEIDEARGLLYIADSGHDRILVATLEGELREAIGGTAGFADGSYAEAQFRDPQGLGLSEDGGTLYVADTRNHAVRAIDLDARTVRTIAGTGRQLRQLPAQPSPGSATALASPWDVLEHDGSLFVTMAGVHQVWRIDLGAETIEVYVGTGAESLQQGPRQQATLAQPSGLALVGEKLYWVDPEGSAVRELDLDEGIVRNVVGTGLFDFGFRDGSGDSALLQHAQGIAAAPDGSLYVADTYNHAVRRVDPDSREVTTIAGNAVRGWEDGAGSDALLNEPAGIDVSGQTAYVADTSNHLLRTIDLDTGETATLALSNLAAILGGTVGPGNVLELALEPQTVAPGAGVLRVLVTTPAEFHLNSLAPSMLSLASSNASVAELGEEALEWSSDEMTVEFPVPVNLGEGEATVTASGTAYYCREGEEALCFIQAVEITAPITVEAGSTNGEVAFTVALPEV